MAYEDLCQGIQRYSREIKVRYTADLHNVIIAVNYDHPEFFYVNWLDRISYPTNNFDYTKTLFFPDDDKLREKQRKTIPPNNNRHPTRLGSARNPFDTETCTEPSKMDVFASSFEKADINNLLYLELKGHLATHKKEKVNDTISKLTIVPDLLKDVIDEIFSTEETGASQVCELPRNPNILKFEIIEEYIRNNDFKTKSEWEQKIQEEYICLKDNKIFPEIIMKSFTNALNSLKKHLLRQVLFLCYLFLSNDLSIWHQSKDGGKSDSQNADNHTNNVKNFYAKR